MGCYGIILGSQRFGGNNGDKEATEVFWFNQSEFSPGFPSTHNLFTFVGSQLAMILAPDCFGEIPSRKPWIVRPTKLWFTLIYHSSLQLGCKRSIQLSLGGIQPWQNQRSWVLRLWKTWLRLLQCFLFCLACYIFLDLLQESTLVPKIYTRECYRENVRSHHLFYGVLPESSGLVKPYLPLFLVWNPRIACWLPFAKLHNLTWQFVLLQSQRSRKIRQQCHASSLVNNCLPSKL